MKKQTLTAKRIARLRKQPGRYRDDKIRGLLLVVTGGRNASWQLRYEIRGKERWMGLGSLESFTLAEARERARRARQQLDDGIDPLEVKRADKAARALADAKSLRFEEAATQYFRQHEKGWGNRKHAAQFMSTMSAYVFPVIGKIAVADVDAALVLKCIEPRWGTIPETMSRTRGRIERILDWCRVRGYRSGDNPARWRGFLENALPARQKIPKTQHHPALPYTELPAFLAALREHEGIAARALEFAILTAARTGEVVGARWDEVNFSEKTWTVPAARMKAKREHRVPLSGRAIELLRGAYREDGNPYILIGADKSNSLSDSAMKSLLRRMDRTDITVHGFRSTFRDWAAERTNYPNDVVEQALAHQVGSGVERAYRRGDLFEKRRKLMDAWAAFCASKPIKTGDLVALRVAT